MNTSQRKNFEGGYWYVYSYELTFFVSTLLLVALNWYNCYSGFQIVRDEKMYSLWGVFDFVRCIQLIDES